MGLLGIMGVVAAIGGTIYFMILSAEQNQKESRFLLAKQELEVFHQGVIALLRDNNSCNLTFQNNTFGSEIDIKEDEKKFKVAKPNGKENTDFGINSLPKMRDSQTKFEQKIKLKKIRIFNPVSPKTNPILPPKAPTMADAPTNKGWVVTVGFLYELYKTKDNEKSVISGSSEMELYHQFTFNNFGESRLEQNPNTCSLHEITSDTWSYQLEDEKGNPKAKAYIMCIDAKPENAIVSCYFPPFSAIDKNN